MTTPDPLVDTRSTMWFVLHETMAKHEIRAADFIIGIAKNRAIFIDKAEPTEEGYRKAIEDAGLYASSIHPRNNDSRDMWTVGERGDPVCIPSTVYDPLFKKVYLQVVKERLAECKKSLNLDGNADANRVLFDQLRNSTTAFELFSLFEKGVHAISYQTKDPNVTLYLSIGMVAYLSGEHTQRVFKREMYHEVEEDIVRLYKHHALTDAQALSWKSMYCDDV